MTDCADKLAVLLRSLKLPSFAAQHAEIAGLAERESWGFSRYLLHLAEVETSDRGARRIERLLRQSGLPPEKTLATLDVNQCH